MSTIEQDIQSFAKFARQQLSDSDSKLTIDELFDMWRAENPSSEELVESVVAVKSALREMEAGDTGIPADEHLAQLRNTFSIPQSE